MATRKQPTNFIISPSELKVYKDSTEPVELSIFNCYEFFVQCNVLIWSTNSFAVKKSKMIIGPRSHASIVLTYTGSREGCSIEKHMFQIVIRDVNTREVIGIRRIIASIFPSEEQPKEECFVSEDSGEKGSTRSVVQVNLEEQKEEEYSGLDDTLVQQNIENSPQHNTSETEEAAEYWAQHKELKDEASNSTKSLGALNNENEKPSAEENIESTWSSVKWYAETIMLVLVLFFLLFLKLKEELCDTMAFETIRNAYSYNVFVE